MGTVVVGLAALLAVVLIPGGGSGHYERWRDGTTHGRWRAVFDGQGETGSRNGSILLRPRAPGSARETHAGLVVSRDFYHDVNYRVRMRTTGRLRRPAPNTWEVAWAVWSYTDQQHFYYLTLKPNGWELGKRDPAYPGGQRFLGTGQPVFPPGRWYTVSVDQRGATLSVRVNGRPLTVQTDGERPYAAGAVGFYTEDAEAEFRSFSASSG
ncbi:family 16 glycoside hydrolase [Actinomadura sp. DC4]|uniref:family 16 glycoside hydrolase n=1 Tax=Actinomadura sp. DC4 TaxID=3055069 RepID=UPI0025AFB5BF|nr:family 16 glycoside hydrolase [Actinomadura sp. DC4]MDN3357713.1 DUF1080 domain-containing protein [Actinomadura sp. DC4]